MVRHLVLVAQFHHPRSRDSRWVAELAGVTLLGNKGPLEEAAFNFLGFKYAKVKQRPKWAILPVLTTENLRKQMPSALEEKTASDLSVYFSTV